MKSNGYYKEISIKEFTRAANIYESDKAGIYAMCKDDYHPIEEELKGYGFSNLLDIGCGTGAMIELLSNNYPDKHYTGLDLTPRMIEIARNKKITNADFIVGDSENLPFPDSSFDSIICSNSFHHYPNPEAFFKEAYRVLCPKGIFVLRDYTSFSPIIWLMNQIELPLANLAGHGDYRIHRIDKVRYMAENAGFIVKKIEKRKNFRLHMIASK